MSESQFLCRRRFAAAICLTVASLFVPGAALAQTYPDRTVRVIVPFAAGGGSDVVGRALAQKLQDKFGQPFVVENRTGAGGSIGANQVARAAPDGYTLLLGSSSEIAQYPNVKADVPYGFRQGFRADRRRCRPSHWRWPSSRICP